ncbi:hypothetical protein OG413_20485 [Streptomyces sp. NBC_01433]|uniref:hypothetical protein n=1 Tax=Streptomyces sp. NBC_01433 TaxID=2903864 RepID=UPI0022588AB9|nr:hypothetical protein [Streptomyces sp. NBC_01433]MCX4677652.1 hypothetical protein [Streptomyces sp. NBC_01433]
MTALAVKVTTPLWGGRVIVRAAGRMALHVAVRGVKVPSMAMFTVPVECCPDAESAPGVRSWLGPVAEDQMCPACLRALRGQPEPVPEPAAQVPETLPQPGPDRTVRPLWAVPPPLGGCAA